MASRYVAIDFKYIHMCSALNGSFLKLSIGYVKRGLCFRKKSVHIATAVVDVKMFGSGRALAEG